MPVPPVSGEALTFFVALTSQANTNIFQVNPTLAIGDVTVSIDGGPLNNITTLPDVVPAGGVQVRVQLSIAEMTGDVICVVFSDVAGAEWQDLYIEILTDTQHIGDIPNASAVAAAIWAGGLWELDSENLIAFVLMDAAGIPFPGLADTFNVFISKAGGAFNPGTGTKAEISNGWYSYLSTAGEADTPGPLAIYITGAGIVQQNLEYVVERRAVNAIEFTYTITDSSTGLPIEGVEVWITTDLARNRVVWYGATDAFGVARDDNGDLPFLDPGTYYFWRQRAGYTFDDPDTEVVS